MLFNFEKVVIVVIFVGVGVGDWLLFKGVVYMVLRRV